MPPETSARPPLGSDGRILFTVHTQTPIDYDPDDLDIEALEFIHRHTMVASNVLFEFMAPKLGSKRYDQFIKRNHQYTGRLPRLFDGGWLDRPAAQEDTKNSYYNRHVYVLTKKTERLLAKMGKLPDVMKHSGPFPHQLMGATFTATLEILCRKAGYVFIPAHQLLGDTRTKLEIPFEWTVKGKVKELDGKVAWFNPDYLYAIKYHKGRTVAYLPEFNRDTEPEITSNPWRRSDIKSARQMKKLIGDKEYKDAYDFRYPLIHQFVGVSESHARKWISLVEEEIPGNPNFTASVMPTFAKPWKPCAFPTYLFDKPWLSTGKPYTIKKPV